MGNEEAEQLGRLQVNLRLADHDQLMSLATTALDELIDIARSIAPGSFGVEVAAAVSAELHRRATATYAPTVGNA